MMYIVFFFKQKTAYEITRRDWSSDVCSSDLPTSALGSGAPPPTPTSGPRASSGCGRSEERRVGKSVPCCVDLGGRRIIKKKKGSKWPVQVGGSIKQNVELGHQSH